MADDRIPELVASSAPAPSRPSVSAPLPGPLWLTHHWPEDYAQRCARVAGHHVCRRCSALYPLGFLVAGLSALGHPPWPPAYDPALIWLLSLPATVAFVGEALGWFPYSPRWQVAAMLVTAVAFGRGLGYELEDRWSPEFWLPTLTFGAVWFAAALVQHRRRSGASRPAAPEPSGQ